MDRIVESRLAKLITDTQDVFKIHEDLTVQYKCARQLAEWYLAEMQELDGSRAHKRKGHVKKKCADVRSARFRDRVSKYEHRDRSRYLKAREGRVIGKMSYRAVRDAYGVSTCTIQLLDKHVETIEADIADEHIQDQVVTLYVDHRATTNSIVKKLCVNFMVVTEIMFRVRKDEIQRRLRDKMVSETPVL